MALSCPRGRLLFSRANYSRFFVEKLLKTETDSRWISVLDSSVATWGGGFPRFFTRSAAMMNADALPQSLEELKSILAQDKSQVDEDLWRNAVKVGGADKSLDHLLRTILDFV